jgi:5-methylcytosine-specific restriction endonuclease McrA
MRCFYCNVELTHTSWGQVNASSEHTYDHLTPKSRGGLTVVANLVNACRACNEQKGTKTLAEYRAWCRIHAAWKLDYWGRFPGER